MDVVEKLNDYEVLTEDFIGSWLQINQGEKHDIYVEHEVRIHIF
jgi:hypothetical protein